MPFHLNRLTAFLANPVVDPSILLSSTAQYGVQLQPAAIAAEAFYWRTIGIHHLTPEENQGKHAVYIDVLDEAGNRLPNLRVRWGWEGQHPHEQTTPKPLDKPANEPAGNVDLYKGQHLWVEIEGEGLPSDRVCNCHTNHPDEPGPTGETWNSIGHHSFYIVFQRTPRSTAIAPEVGSEPTLKLPDAAATDHAVYVRDRIADGSLCLAGAPIEQVWTVRNSGTTVWGEGYVLAHERGDRLNAPAVLPLPATAPGGEVDLPLTLTAPVTPGRWRCDWKLRNPAGEWFGERLWVDVQVEPSTPAIDTPATPTLGNKLGFYLHLSTDQDGLWDAIDRLQPPVLLIHADTANTLLLEEIRRFRAPNALVIGRLYKDVHTQRQMLESADPEAQGRAMAEEILQYNFGLATKRGANGRLLIDAWMSLNEAVPGPASDQFAQQPQETTRLLHNYDRFQVAFRQKLQEAGVEAIAFNFGAGNFATAEHYLTHFPNTLASYTYLGFHEYGWPTLYPTASSATSAGSYRPCMEGIRARYGARHRVIITEAGLTRMYQNPALGDVGWLNGETPLSQDAYWQSLEWYNNQMNADGYVLGACLFEVGHHGQWASFRHLGRDHQNQPITLIDRMVALKERAQPRRVSPRAGVARGVETASIAPAAQPLLTQASITIAGVATHQGRPVAGATVRLIGTQETLGGVTGAATNAGSAVTWTRRITGFDGTVGNAWRKYVANQVAGLTYIEFKQRVAIYNPALVRTDGQFSKAESYLLPENPHVTNPHITEQLWDRPLINFAGSLWSCWQQYVANKVIGLSYADFKRQALLHNPRLKQDGKRFLATERYRLPRNAGPQRYTLTALTDGRGQFRFADVPVGAYQIEVRAPNMQPFLTGFSAVANVQLPVTLQPNLPAQPRATTRSSVADPFVRVFGNEFAVNGRPLRFIGVNIRGIVHYGDGNTLKHANEGHRREQLAAAYDMGARVVRIFLPSMHATPEQTLDRFAQVLQLTAEFPGLYLLPALSNLYSNVPFRVPGDEGFYARVDPKFESDLLNADFFTGGYRRNFLPFAQQAVNRFRNEPRIFAWEIGNELKLNPAIGDLNNDPHVAAFINFKLTVAKELRQLDPNHLITTGMISTHHAWLHNDDLRHRLYGSPLIDFLTIHCYNHEYENDDSRLAEALNKPFIIEEAGFDDERGEDRSGKVIDDMQRWFGLGARGYMQWGFMATAYDMEDGDKRSGMDRALHRDWDPLFHAYRSKATALQADLPTWTAPPVAPAAPEVGATQPAASAWQPGQIVFAQDWLNVRKSPGHVGKLGDDVLGMMAPGAAATLRDVAVVQDGLTWWPLQTTLSNGAAVTGWGAAANATTVLLATTTPPTASARGARGGARSATTGGQQAFAQSYVNLRKDPGYVGKTGDHVIGQIPHGAPILIIGGPQAADALTWWQVRAPLLDNNTAEGWVAEVDPDGNRLIDGTPPPAPTTVAPESTLNYLGRSFTVGSAVTVVAVAANVRATAAYIGQPPEHVMGQTSRGAKWTTQAGPLTADGIDWLEVASVTDTMTTGGVNRGWIAIADPRGARLLTPAPVAAAIALRPPFAVQWALSQGWGGWPEEYGKITYDGVPLKGHNGLDFATPVGTPLLAVDDGVVKRVDYEVGGFGNFVLIEHAWGESLYAHLARVDLPQNATVAVGQPIGLSGETGHCYGAHLHFGIRLFPYRRTDGWGGFCDPSPFLDPTFLATPRGGSSRPQPMAPELPGRLRP